MDEISKNKFKSKEYDQAPFMTTPEKKISFLNRYFVYKKIRTVNTENVELELGEYEETSALRNAQDTKHAQKVAVEEVKKLKPKVRKLSKKILLAESVETNATDEPTITIVKPTTTNVKPNTKKEGKSKISKKIVIESDDDEDEA